MADSAEGNDLTPDDRGAVPPNAEGSPSKGSPSSADGSSSDVDGLAAGGAALTSPEDEDTFPVVGIGASAGGLRAFQEFFSALPPAPGMAFVLVQHLSPDHESTLAELIQTRTQMTVTQVADHPDVEPNRVYVIPPGKHLEIEDGHLQLVEVRRDRGRPAAVDHFFRTLAEDMGERAVCIVLSGTGSDGSLGLKAVKERTGLTMAQTPSDAEYGGMPQSAIQTDLVDVQGAADELATRLVEIRNAAGRVEVPVRDSGPIPEDDHQALQAIFAHLRKRTAHDFSQYKRATILRRLARRLQVTGQGSLPEYASYLRSTPDEVPSLLRDFLISVTQFFRDPPAFDVLEREVIPLLFLGKTAADQVRVWVAGCATGEEAYSVAMLLCEHRSRLDDPPDLQVFATDIDEDALDRAREGHYANVATADVPPSLLRRYFDTEPDGVRVKPELRQMVLFANHNLISDPPFSRLDLVACRNVLIYLERKIQTRIFATFHYSLRPEGFLFLGSAEGLDALTKGFGAVDKKARIYRRQQAGAPARLPSYSVGDGRRGAPPRPRPADPPREGLVERYRDWTLQEYAPPRLLVDEHYDVTHVFGDAGAYLRDREGPVTQNVVDKVLRAFRIDLRAALFRAFSSGESTETPFKRVEVGGRERVARLHVGRVGGAASQDGLAEVVFIELDAETVSRLGAAVAEPEGGGGLADDSTAAQLEEEIRSLRARLQATVDESETSTEELKASNEELRSTNEELQSTTEELETSKEELQSTNEELTTVNQELKTKVEELIRANSDLQNLIAATDIGTVFLDRSLRVKRYTPTAEDVFHIIPADVGRPFAHLTHRLLHDGLVDNARRVLETLVPEEEEVEDDAGRWHAVRLLPYRTVDDRIEGVVLTLVEITELKRARDEARRRGDQQGVVADLGDLALSGAPLDALFETACERTVGCLDVVMSAVFRHQPDEGALVLEAGTGWADGSLGAATVPDDGTSQVGFTLAAEEPVVVRRIAEEGRFAAPPLFEAHGVRSGLGVAIPGPEGPWGVFGVHCAQLERFSEDDAQFIRAVANVLGKAVRRERDARTIREQLAEIEAVYGTAPVGLAYMDHELRYRRINERLAEINGLPVQEHIGKRGKELFPLLADMVEPILLQVVETGEAVEDIEFQGTTLRDPDDLRDWLCSYVPELDDDEGVMGVSVVVRDITARKRAEAQLAKTVERLELAMDTPGLGGYEIDLARGTVTYDARAQALLQEPRTLPTEEAAGRVHPEDRPGLDAALGAALDPDVETSTFRDVHRHVRPDGSMLWLSARGRVVFEGEGDHRQPVRLSGMVFDVTDLHGAQARLQQELAEVESYFDAVPVGIAVLDREGRYLKVNQRLSAITGMEAGDLVGRAARDLWPDHAPTNEPYLQRVIETGVPVLNVEMALPTPAEPEGPAHHWLVSFIPLLEGGTVRGVSVVIQDVTAIRRAQAGLERLTEELEDRVVDRTEQVRRLATELTYAEQAERKRIGQVLHDDLQQLLYALQVRMEMVARAIGTSGAATASLGEANRLIERAVQATRTLTVDLSPPLLEGEGFERALHWVAHRMEEAHGLRVTVEGETEVEVNPDIQILLSRIIRELLFNVVKHADTDEVRLCVETDGDRVAVTVSDEGNGFDVDAATNGSGFGLFSSRERLVVIGGDLTVESAPGAGTTVRVVGPARV